ncbi:hypothetical protein COL07_09430 [Bacillus cereus]|uniref:hypothetical protein n=1 Tax=Bacillus cereus TaxID=1396 RepID=UPI000BFA80E1|nr:hypothetical protein [Bacillus cereus]PFW30365.1 hypothetical protein COL07_09430 [Bacillus cereus]
MSKLRTNIMQPGKVQLFDSRNPKLLSDNYKVTVSQEIQWEGADGILETCEAKATQDFFVRGPRFYLDPMDIATLHPFPKAQNQFENLLPYITLANPVLPSIKKVELSSGETVPWLTLLVLRDDEWTNDGDPISNTVEEFLKRDTGVLLPIYEDEIEEKQKKQNCTYIEIPIERLRKLAPKKQELQWLSHARTSEHNKDEGISVIFSNRLPTVSSQQMKGQQFAVYLVSLEGHQCYLDEDISCEKADRVRLLTFTHWKFTSLPENKENFRDLIKSLVNNAQVDKEQAWLRLPVSSLPQDTPINVKNRLKDGFVPHGYHTRSGERTITWYRSPFIPVINGPERPSEKKYYTSNEEIIYDSENGIFDVSWSAAGQLGRFLALTNKDFAVHLSKWRRQLAGKFIKRTFNDEEPGERWRTFEDGLCSKWADNIFEALSNTSKKEISSSQRMAWRKERRDNRPDLISKLRKEMERDIDPDINTLMPVLTNEARMAIDWLNELTCLEKVPLPYFVSNELTLPMESIRFFYIDINWIKSLLDGAISIGAQTYFDIHINKYIINRINLPRYKYGFITRSALISGWPGIQIEGWKSNVPIQITKTRLQEQVLMCLFEDIPDKITLTEPHEEFSFGVNDDPERTINLRYTSIDKLGVLISRDLFPIKDYISDLGVLNISDLQQKISEVPEISRWSPALFALQMLNAADQGVFKRSGT